MVVAYSFKGLVLNNHDGEHGGMKTDIVLEKKAQSLISCSQQEVDKKLH